MIEVDPGMNIFDDEPGAMSGDYYNKCPACNNDSNYCTVCGGAGIVGFRWHVETEWADCHWVMTYVGGEDPDYCHDSYPTRAEAEKAAATLNALPINQVKK